MKRLMLVLFIMTGIFFVKIFDAYAERSPIFSTSSVEILTDAASSDISARGAYADYFGSAAISMGYTGYIYAFYARNYAVSNSATEQAWYSTATTHFYYAYVFFYYALVYSQAGM